MKKILSLCLTALLLLSVFTISASAMEFTDLSADHWAYDSIQTLVADGTINGIGDGTFLPDGKVTRAQFVKMLGKSATAKEKYYDDVAPNHWAYDYITYSDFPEVKNNVFQPDIPITRGLVAELLWIRNGKDTDVFAPAIITSQYKANPTAAAWIYTTGLMKGDGDGIKLRLNDGLSRAEAATLIVRARIAAQNKNVFASLVNDDVLKNVYNGLSLFDGKAYNPDATMTNGELARAALRIGSQESNLTYRNQNTKTDFEHPYAKDIAAVCNACLGADRLSAAFADKEANFGDAAALLTYNFIAQSSSGVIYGDTTPALEGKVNQMMNICLTFAKNNGIISLKEDLSKTITVREFTALCLLLDNLIGSETDYTTDTGMLEGKDNHSLLLTTEPYGDFRVVLENVPSALYSTAFNNQKKAPVDTYNYAREYKSFFLNLLNMVKANAGKAGATIRLTYYPSLVCENGNGYTMRIACEIVSMNGTNSFSNLFPVREGMENADLVLSQGKKVYFDLATGGPFTSIVASAEKAYVDQIVLVK